MNVSHGTVAVTGASGTVLAANANRRYLLLQNDDASATIYLRLGTAAAVLNSGLRLNAAGGSHEMTMPAGNLWTGAITGIVASGTARLLYTQGTAAMA